MSLEQSILELAKAINNHAEATKLLTGNPSNHQPTVTISELTNSGPTSITETPEVDNQGETEGEQVAEVEKLKKRRRKKVAEKAVEETETELEAEKTAEPLETRVAEAKGLTLKLVTSVGRDETAELLDSFSAKKASDLTDETVDQFIDEAKQLLQGK